MRYILFFILFPILSKAQVKQDIVIPPSTDTTIVVITTYPAKTDYMLITRSPAPGNKPPIANAGNDVAITLPTNTVTLSAVSSTDADGSIASYKWEKVNGPAATLTQVNTAANVSGLAQGIYVFRVTVIDNGGLSDQDQVTVTVNPSPVTPPTGTRQNIIFEAGFDGSKPFLTENELYKQACCTYSVTQSKSIVRSGDGSFRAEVRGSDANVSSGYRAEFITKNSYNTDAWYGYSTYFENWSACSSCGEHAIQWHPAEGSGSANLGIYTEKGTFHVRLNADGDLTAETLKDGLKITPNKWYDFVWHVKWSAAAGRIELWIDGVKYVDYLGPTLTKGGTPYFKLGINRWNISGVTRVLYYDNLRIGNALATYKDVAP